MEATVYILLFNSEVMFASKTITVLHASVLNQCQANKHALPEPYATVRRRILADSKYSHMAAPGYNFHIVVRSFLRKPIQHRLGFFKDTVVKQSSLGS